jgi:dipeptidyl aminopeptidase/acylaminoacyl peptidase
MRRIAALILVLSLTASIALAQTGYKTPPAAIVRALEAPPLPGVSLDPHRRWMVLTDRVTLPPISDLAQPMLRLAGDRINPSTNGPYGPRRTTGLTLKAVDGGAERRIELPADSNLSGPSWSPDGSRFVFTRTTDRTIELWLADVGTAKARKLADALNAVSGSPVRWMPDGKRLLVRFIPANRAPMPEPPKTPTGPVAQETANVKAQVRTYQDLLQNAHDEQVWEWLSTAQLAYLDADSGKRTDLGSPAIYSILSPSPDGMHLLVSRTVRPFSYLVPGGLFPEIVEIWEASTGRLVKEIHKAPLREDIPIQGVEKGPRSFQWRDTAAATILWAEALDEGDPKNKVPHRDRVMVLSAPFTAAPAEWFKTEHRFTGCSWLEDDGAPAHTGLALISEYDRDRRWSRTWLYNADSSSEPRLVWDRSVQDRYNAPGAPLTTRLPNGQSVIRVEDGSIFLAGPGATAEGDRPFLDRLSLADLKTQRLWRNEGENFESVIDMLDAPTRIMTSYETPTEPANYCIRDLTANSRAAVTNFKDPVPELRRLKKEIVRYKRPAPHEVDLSATLYLPADYDPASGKRLPLLVWAYPLEFNDTSTAGQVSGSPYRFTAIGGISHLFLLTQGYAIMDNATMPVIGDPETVNDTFVEQITAAASAAIDYAAARGIADPGRVAVGGHSYGAFMTANLLAHTDLFKAGIARSGAYNRTLTPFGFQGERRTYWEAVETYTKMSPFTFAHQIKRPLLMLHGQMDSNPGTFPIQSERLYAAIKGHGGTARLVMLPYEDHGYAARESVYHTLAEMVEWLDRHVKSDVSAPVAPQQPRAKERREPVASTR